jgi:SNF2 family DNA or RNA helicase
VEYHGGTSTQDRQDAVRKFQNGEANFFLGTSAAAKGLTLHRAHTMVYYANTYSLEARLQSQDRIHRHGQKNECTYIDLVVPESLDQMIIDRLTQKKDLADMVLTDLQKAIQS